MKQPRPAHVSTLDQNFRRVLQGLGFSLQRPERRDIERDEDAVRTWKRQTWQWLKRKTAARTG